MGNRGAQSGTRVFSCNADQEVNNTNDSCGCQAGDGKPHAGEHEKHYQKGRCELVQLFKQVFIAAGIDIGSAGGHTGQQGRYIEGGADTGHAHDGDAGQDQAVVLAAAFVYQPAEHHAGQSAQNQG